MNLSPLISRVAVLVLATLGWSLRAQENPAPAKHGYTVNVNIKVNEKGETESITLADSEDTSTGGILSKMAIAMAAKATMPVRQKDGHPIKYAARVPYFFPIEGDEGAEANLAPRPRVKTAVEPAYPLAAANAGEVGGAILELIIDTQGKIAKLTTLRASRADFEEAAVQAAKQWTFVPAEKDGKPVESRWRMALVFETPEKITDIRYRIAPRPSLGSFIKFHDNRPLPAPAPAAPPAAPAVPATSEPEKK